MSLSLEHKQALAELLSAQSITRSALAAALDEEADEWRKRAVNAALGQATWEQRRDAITEAATKAKYADGLLSILLAKANK